MMRTVRQMMNEKAHRLLSIQPEHTVYDALLQMAEHDVGALIVLRGEQLVGIFSERDYARKIILDGKTSKLTPISAVMTHDVICVDPDRTADECMALMTEKHVRHLPIIENKAVVGLISIGDVVREMISDQKHTIEQLEQYIMS
jgi:CBS domain-containing protein